MHQRMRPLLIVPSFVAILSLASPRAAAQAQYRGGPPQGNYNAGQNRLQTGVRQPAPGRRPPPRQTNIIPSPFGPLTPKHQAYLDEILKYWEFRSGQIKRYRCAFQRWEYDCVYGPKDPNIAKTFSKGVIKYQAPDKGLFKVEQVMHYKPPAQPGQQGSYVKQEGTFGEHWVCDGKSVTEINHRLKKLTESELPPHMRGKAIADGPLPFLFGAKAAKIKARYWLRVITPPNTKGEYWLEAYPKTRADADSFRKVEVIIDEQKWLPKAIQVFPKNYDQRRNPSRTVFQFENRELNWNPLLDKLPTPWAKEFFQPATPRGYEKVVRKYQPVMAGNRMPPPRNHPPRNQARGPARDNRRRR